MARPRPGVAACRGFTFIELMYAAAFFLFGLAGLLTMDAAANKQLAAALHQSRAQALASNTAALCALLPLGTLQAMRAPAALGYDVEGKLLAADAASVFYRLLVMATPNVTGGTDSRVQVQWTEPATGEVRQLVLQNAVPVP